MEFIVKIGYRCDFKFLSADDALKFALAAKCSIVDEGQEVSIIIQDEPQEEGEADV